MTMMIAPKETANFAVNENICRQGKGVGGAIASPPLADFLEKMGQIIADQSGYSCTLSPELYFKLRIFKDEQPIAGIRFSEGRWQYTLTFDGDLEKARVNRRELEALLGRVLEEVGNNA